LGSGRPAPGLPGARGRGLTWAGRTDPGVRGQSPGAQQRRLVRVARPGRAGRRADRRRRWDLRPACLQRPSAARAPGDAERGRAAPAPAPPGRWTATADRARDLPPTPPDRTGPPAGWSGGEGPGPAGAGHDRADLRPVRRAEHLPEGAPQPARRRPAAAAPPDVRALRRPTGLEEAV